MRIRLIAIGNKMPAWVDQGFAEYQKRLSGSMPLELVDIMAGKRIKNTDLNRIMEREGSAMLSAIPASDRVIALDVKGLRLTTNTMAERLQGLMQEGRNLSLLVGGPEGLAQACIKRADETWSLSDLTLPHPLVRVVIAEQLYRCWTLIKGHPYHR
jgi:23S rRNA (pseudouridine1915-N3)-methyltransferase